MKASKKEILSEVFNIRSIIREADEDAMTCELVAYALQAMKENPELSISDAMIVGYGELYKW